MNPSLPTIRIAILVFPDCLQSGAVVPVDVFRIANAMALYRPAAEHIRFEAEWVGARGASITSENGLQFPTCPIEGAIADVLILPGIDHDTPQQIAGLLDKLGPEVAAVRAFATGGGMIATNCSSTFLLAQAGLLDGRRATTSWWLSREFIKRYPQVQLDTEEMIVHDGQFVTSGGFSSYVDLALKIVGQFGSEQLRQITAKVLVTDSNRASQTPYIATGYAQGDGQAIIERARRWLSRHMDQEWNIADLAEHCHTSPRTLLRRFQKAVGLSPVQYTQQLRVERAKSLLESTTLSLEEITGRCGYENVSTFSKVFKRWANVTPREYRGRFGLRI
ncbi:MAG: helix-turn-helix domain-containing protein [Pseudomonadota bacterium]